MGIFSKEKITMEEALDRARKDEREKTIVDRDKYWNAEIFRLEGKWSLQLKEKQAELDSVLLRMKELEGREKKVEAERQKNREASMLMRKILSDVKYLSDKERQEEVEKRQCIDRLAEESVAVDQLMLEPK